MKNKFFEQRRNWFSQFSSAFVGTLLGIGITVGINGYIEYRSDKATAEKFLLKTIEEIDSRYSTLASSYKSMEAYSDTFRQMRYVYEDDPAGFSEELGEKFVSAILPFDMFMVNDLSQQMFSSNIEVLEVFKDLSIVSDISQTFTMLTKMEQVIREMEVLRRKIYDEFSKDYDWSLILLPEEFEEFMDRPEVINAMQLYNMKMMVLPTLLGYIKDLNESIKSELGITEDQLAEVRVKRTTDVDFEESESESTYEGENSSIHEEFSIRTK